MPDYEYKTGSINGKRKLKLSSFIITCANWFKWTTFPSVSSSFGQKKLNWQRFDWEKNVCRSKEHYTEVQLLKREWKNFLTWCIHLLDWELWLLPDVKPRNPEWSLWWQQCLSGDGQELAGVLPQTKTQKQNSNYTSTNPNYLSPLIYGNRQQKKNKKCSIPLTGERIILSASAVLELNPAFLSCFCLITLQMPKEKNEAKLTTHSFLKTTTKHKRTGKV